MHLELDLIVAIYLSDTGITLMAKTNNFHAGGIALTGLWLRQFNWRHFEIP